MGFRWGPSKDLDYWTARAADLVPPPERRAMALLASMTDEARFSFYCAMGEMPAMGNVTKRIYLIRRHDRVLELEDGRPYRSWCIGTSDRSSIPESDHVVTMKTLIEGEELAFRETGNPGDATCFQAGKGGLRNPYLTPFHEDEEEIKYAKENEDISDFMDVKKAVEGIRSVYELKKNMWDAVVREGPPELEELLGRRREPQRQKPNIGFVQYGAVGGAGTNPTQVTMSPFVVGNTATNVNFSSIAGGVFMGNGIHMTA